MSPARWRHRRTRVAFTVIIAAGTAVAGGIAGLAITACAAARGASGQPGRAGTLRLFATGYQRVIRDVLPSVVEISAGASSGSGVVLDHRGDIVTNAQVLGTARNFRVRVAVMSHPLPARLIGTFAPDDLAVIRVTRGASDLTPARWANSARVRVGAIVLAMGSPYGLTDSVTLGIVSATGRTVTDPGAPASQGQPGEPGRGGQPPSVIPGAIQTSAAINPGNGGGALVLLSGEVIGIPTLTAADPEIGGAAPGIGFAIPANTVRDIASQLVRNGKVTRSGRTTLDFTGRSFVYADGTAGGVTVDAVRPGGAAARAGITPGEVIAGVGGQATPNLAQLENVLTRYQPGQKVPVEVLRHGNPRQVTVTLGRLTG